MNALQWTPSARTNSSAPCLAAKDQESKDEGDYDPWNDPEFHRGYAEKAEAQDARPRAAT